MRTATFATALAVGLLIGLGFLFATGQPLWPATESGVDFTQFSVPFIVTTTFSTLCCWAMIRHWHLPPQTSARLRFLLLTLFLISVPED